MIISLYRLKRLAIVAAVILIPFIFIVAIQALINSNDRPVVSDLQEIEQLQMPTGSTVTGNDEEIGFFAEYRIERERVRGKQMELLSNIADNPNQEQKVRNSASLKLVQIADDLAREMQTETLIKSKGFKECAVILDSKGMTIILDQDTLSEELKKELQELSSAVSGVDQEKIIVTTRARYR
ncbi:MAG TPA: SpoIIIAH-like family protein [Syntrophomonas sp.]|nr:SpoIIIAH-like family protein [Syntrophomonas sp.]